MGRWRKFGICEQLLKRRASKDEDGRSSSVSCGSLWRKRFFLLQPSRFPVTSQCAQIPPRPALFSPALALAVIELGIPEQESVGQCDRPVEQ